MELFYRGTIYERHPSKAFGRPFQQVREPGLKYYLSYRGVLYRMDTNTKPTFEPVAHKIICRGLVYEKQICQDVVTYLVTPILLKKINTTW